MILSCRLGVGVTFRTGLLGVDGTYQAWSGGAYPDVLMDLPSRSGYVPRERGERIDPYTELLTAFDFAGSILRELVQTSTCITRTTATRPGRCRQFSGAWRTLGLGLPMHDLRTGHVSMLNIGLVTRGSNWIRFHDGQDSLKFQ